MIPRFILIGGFLGAGKSTTVARLAKHFTSQGLKVGIVTNDQTTDLVDTHSLRSQGFDVGEVAGACFCCSFNELTQTVDELTKAQLPDVIIAEPVGSCTDLVATVIRPLQSVYEMPLDIAPYGVILKPSHGLRILSGEQSGGFSPKAEYIFRKQIEEADFVIINRIDELAEDKVSRLADLIQQQYPGRRVIRMSAKTGQGFDAYVEFLKQQGQFGSRVMEVDYDIYAEGEAELGWLNCQFHFATNSAIALDALLTNLVSSLQSRLTTERAEIAHLKAIGMADGNYAVANSVSSFTDCELSLASRADVTRADVVVNARVAIDPSRLELIVREQIGATCKQFGGSATIDTLQSFRPGRPIPTHRIPVS
ncbi:MAG: cobalamin biosynthesis protein P47K [Pirellulaceae bacterium]|jgi:Ni2+-binding GTPase involved in maturation of urease and hydrogenase|nr:cobalamin biosynthesis protein P47K [Pirellulaceae bacterium]